MPTDSPTTIDAHAHALSPRLVELTADHQGPPNPHRPGHYLKRVWVDALVYEPRNLAHLTREMGASQVVLGTDYPFNMGEEHPLDVLRAVEGLSDGDRDRIQRGNALDLLGMPA